MKKRLNVLCLLMLSLMLVKFILELKGSCVFVNSTLSNWGGDMNKTTFIITFGVFALIFSYPIVRGMVSFIRFILNVNRDKIFVKQNVSLLRWAGGALIYMSIFTLPSLFINQRVEYGAIDISSAFLHESLPIILGFVFLIIAEVFVIGIKLREEQELTI